MRFGFTYDLRDDYLAEGYGAEETAEFDRPDTIDGIAGALAELGHEVVRVGHIRDLVARLAAGERWDMVFNIAEGLIGPGREAQVPALLDAWRIPYTFSGPVELALTLDKALTKLVVREAGIPTPAFAVVRGPEDVARVRLPWPLFCKPVAEGTGKGIGPDSRVESLAELEQVCRRLLAAHDSPAGLAAGKPRLRRGPEEEFLPDSGTDSRRVAPVLVETFLPGREFTVGITGTGPSARVLGVMEVVFTDQAGTDIYGYAIKQDYVGRVEYRLAEDAVARRAGETALAGYCALGCRDAGRVDLRCDAAGEPCFLEVNALPGLNPVHSDLPIMCRLRGIGFRELIGMIVDSALARWGREGG
ncbi:MAG: D-alanine--D-alanine ligase [bacterium]